MIRNLRFAIVALSFVLLSGSAVAAENATPAASPVAGDSIGSLSLIGMQTVPNDLVVDGTLVGGLSGISYDAANNLYYIISDDKSDVAPARFYTAELNFDSSTFSSAKIDAQTTLLQKDGTPYPNTKTGGNVPDAESIRVDPVTGNIWWSTEGISNLNVSPSVHVATKEGAYVSTVNMPAMFTSDPAQATGPRDNLGFEGLSFSPDGSSVWVGMETALIQDGPIATNDAGAVARFTHIDRDGKVLGQFAYPVDPIQAVPTGQGADNGVSEILAIDDAHLLVVERSGVSQADGKWLDYIRIYEVDLTGATDISGVASLKGATYTPASKHLLLDMSKMGAAWVDNLEGITWGPTLSNGDRSLVLVSDNNFNADTQVTQFWALDVQP